METLKNSQYFISSSLPYEASWADAQATCKSVRGFSNLAQIDDVIENIFILSLLFQLRSNDSLENRCIYFGNK